MNKYYADADAPEGGIGTEDRPFNSIGDHANDLLPGDYFYLMGIFTERMIHLSTSGLPDAEISILPWPGAVMPTIYTKTGDYMHQHTVSATGSYWRVNGVRLDMREQFNGGCIDNAGNRNSFDGCELLNVTGDWFVRFRDGNYNTFRNGWVHNGLKGGGQDCHGVLLDGGRGNRVLDSTFERIGGDGVQGYDRVPLYGATVARNIFRGWAGKSEQGGDFKWAVGLNVYDNTASGFHYLPGRSNGEGFFLHGRCQDVVFANNTVFDSDGAFRLTGRNIRAMRNLVYDLRESPDNWANGAFVVTNAPDATIQHNTVVRSPGYSVFVGESSQATIENNLFWEAGRPGVDGSVRASNNGFFDCEPIPGDGNVIGSDPLLADDYRLLEGSPARGAGVAGADLGAFPYIPPEQPIPPTDESLEGVMDRIAEGGGSPYAYRDRRVWFVGLATRTDEPAETLQELWEDDETAPSTG